YNVVRDEKKLINKGIESNKKKGIISHAAETNLYYFSGNVLKDPYYIKEFDDVNSELAVPIRYANRVIGVINIYSTEMNFFNDRKANIVQIIADEAGKVFQKKKINQTIKNLVVPFQFFAGSENIYHLIIDNIRDYFITEFVSVWERIVEHDLHYKLVIACDKLGKKYREFGLGKLKQGIIGTSNRDIQLINFEDPNQPDCGFNDFAKENELKAMILVPIIVDQQVYGFINIFSKRELPFLFAEDKTFLNLIASKGAISVQYEKLISSFMEVSSSLPSENLDRILKNIADNAAKVLHADPVILFRYNSEQSIFDITISGFLFYPELKEIKYKFNNPPNNFTSNIIINGSAWFESSSDYRKCIRKLKRERETKHFDKDFWAREKIKSSVGIRLEHNNEPIGVMFFNYRTEQKFDKDTRRFIEAFSSLASSAIVNAKYLDLIEKQKEELEEQKKQILTKKEELEFDYERIAAINQIVQKISADDDLSNNLQTILEEVIKILKCEIGYIALLDRQSKIIKPTCKIGIEDHNFPYLEIGGKNITSGWVFRNKKVVLWPSGKKEIDSMNVPFNNFEKEVETEIIAPLLYEDEVIGSIEVASYKRGAFKEQDKLFLKAVADQITVIIQNKKIHIATEKLAEILFDEKDFKNNCDILAETADEILENTITCVWLKRNINDRNCLVMESSHGAEIENREEYNMFEGEGGISWRTVEKRKEIIIPENLSNPEHGFKHLEFVKENKLESMISVPLIVVNEVIGVINSYSRRSYKFSDKEVNLLKSLAAKGAIAIKNAELTKQMEEVTEKILDSAQLSNPGQVALSFTHDAKHTMHNINALISSLIYFLPENIRKIESVESVISSLTKDTDYLRNLFNSLVRYAKITDIDYRPTKLRDIIEYIMYIYQVRLNKNHIECEITYNDDELKELQIECDRNQIEQVFLNLFNNSIYAIKEKMSRGGFISIFIRNLDEKYIEIQFKDNGIGIFPK
ncbi:MAG: GAF domain-containing protein, partial [Candidatus Thorarchaeota archaeon]